MTPDELDAVLSERPDLNPFEEALIAALREAWHERDAYRKAKAENDERFMLERDEARAEVERLRRGEVDGVFTSVVHGCCERAEKAEAAIARVRALCDEAERWALSSPSVSTSRIRAALDRVAPMRAWGIDPGEAE